MSSGDKVIRCRGDQAAVRPCQARRSGAHFSPFHLFTLSPAFTLVEMLVSLAVLALVLGVIGVVFTVTTKTAGQASAYSETLNWVRQLMLQLDEDLKYCDPSGGPLVLVGRTPNAALTQADLDAGKFYRVLMGDPAQVPRGYDPAYNPNLDNADPAKAQYSNPRADILAFITNRPTISQAPPAVPTPNSLGEAAAKGAKLAPARVVYGHAALADVDLSKTPPDYVNWRHIEQTVTVGTRVLSIIPANHWHLSRQAVILAPWPAGTTPPTGLAAAEFTQNACPNIVGCRPYQESNVWMPGDAAYLNLPFLLDEFGASPQYIPAPPTPLLSPYTFSDNNTLWKQQAKDVVNSLLYSTHTGSPTNHHVATVLENMPVEARQNMGVQMLPSCAWFQVEFLMPEDPRNSLDYSPNPNDPNVTDPSLRTDMPRWTAVEPGKTYVFVPDTADNRAAVAAQAPQNVGTDRIWTFARLDQDGRKHTNLADAVQQRRIRTWPYAIRITVRVYDPRGRLDQPIVRSLVHRFD